MSSLARFIQKLLSFIGFMFLFALITGFFALSSCFHHNKTREKSFELSGHYKLPSTNLVKLVIDDPILPESTRFLLDKMEVILQVAKEGKLKGLLVEVNSPGGTPAGSQELFFMIQKIGEHIPVVAFCHDSATSGAYYAIAAAHHIMTTPATLVASIGVRTDLWHVQDLIEKWGLKKYLITSGPLKAPFDPFQNLTPEGKRFLETLIQDLARQFIEHVKTARKLSDEAVQKVSDGRVVLGEEGVALGLVDSIGTRFDAHNLLREMAKVDQHEPIFEIDFVDDENWFEMLSKIRRTAKAGSRLLKANWPSMSSRIHY